MNTITIDSDMYKDAVEYARRYNMSVREVVEYGIQLVIGSISGKTANKRAEKVHEPSLEEALGYMDSIVSDGFGKMPVPADDDGRDARTEKYML